MICTSAIFCFFASVRWPTPCALVTGVQPCAHPILIETGMKVPPSDMCPLPYDSIELSKPTIAAVNGHAMAGGWMIAQACDLCVASANAKFAITEVKVGRGSPWAAPLIHMIPQRIFIEIVLTGKPISAERAYEIGLVNRLEIGRAHV